jgi:hypothetical protein
VDPGDFRACQFEKSYYTYARTLADANCPGQLPQYFGRKLNCSVVKPPLVVPHDIAEARVASQECLSYLNLTARELNITNILFPGWIQ